MGLTQSYEEPPIGEQSIDTEPCVVQAKPKEEETKKEVDDIAVAVGKIKKITHIFQALSSDPSKLSEEEKKSYDKLK